MFTDWRNVHALAGWVFNGEEGVEIYLEGAEPGLQAFVQDLKAQSPPAAGIASIDVLRADPQGLTDFTIRESQRRERPTVRISPDLPVCDACLEELFDSANRRYWYPLHQLHELRTALYGCPQSAL